MKKIERLVLHYLAKKEIHHRQMGKLRGGKQRCTCGCCYAGSGGGSDVDYNGCANWKEDKTSYCPDSPIFLGSDDACK